MDGLINPMRFLKLTRLFILFIYLFSFLVIDWKLSIVVSSMQESTSW